MAAIIAQMTRANRERKKKKRIEISKCMYDLPPFDNHFEAQLHNKYFRAKKATAEKSNALKFHDVVRNRLDELVDQAEEGQSFRWRESAN